MERWAQIQAFPNYEISTAGRVRNRRTLGVLRSFPVSAKARYQRVTLYHEGQRVPTYVHTTVLETFVGPCPANKEACHRDGNPENNRLSNLRWGTRLENCADRTQHGRTICRGETHPWAKLTQAQVCVVKQRLGRGEKSPKIAQELGVTYGAIYAIETERNWAHVHVDEN